MKRRCSRRRFVLGSAGTAVLSACGGLPRLHYVATSAAADRRLGAADAAPATPQVVDAHCHVFSARDLDIDAFLRGLVRAEELPRPLRVSVEMLTGAIHKLAYGAADAPGKDAVEAALGLLPVDKWPQIKPLLLVNNVLQQAAPVTSNFKKMEALFPSTRLFLPAMVDFEHWVPRRKGLAPPTPFAEQVAAMSALAEQVNVQGAAPRMLPLIAFNPLRELKDPPGAKGSHFEQVKQAIVSGGFVGIKLYPPCGFGPWNNDDDPALQEPVRHAGQVMPLGKALDAVLKELYRWCETEHVPIMAHANNSNAMRRNAGFLASPWGWREVLARYPSLRLNLAHFGHVEGASSNPDVASSECVSWSKHIVQLMNKYDNVYADIGYSSVMDESSEFVERYRRYLCELQAGDENKRMPERLMFGSDWWMIELDAGSQDYFEKVHGFFAQNFPAWQRVWSDNALQFLGLGLKDNKNAARISAKWGTWLQAIDQTA